MPGPPPKPTALKKAQGNPGKRALNKSEPSFGGPLDCPEWLLPLAKEEWTRVAEQLAALDMLQSVDRAALAAYCQAYARWMAAEQEVMEEGQTFKEPIKDKQNNVVGYKIRRHPATTIAKDERAAMLRASALFGFDPSSRSRLHSAPPEEVDEFSEFMKGSISDDIADESGEVHSGRPRGSDIN